MFVGQLWMWTVKNRHRLRRERYAQLYRFLIYWLSLLSLGMWALYVVMECSRENSRGLCGAEVWWSSASGRGAHSRISTAVPSQSLHFPRRPTHCARRPTIFGLLLASYGMADDFEQTSATFLNWFLSLPSANINPKVQLADLRHKDCGRGVVALEDIRKDSELFTVPPSGIISAANSSLFTLLPSESSSEIREDAWLALILVLIYEYLHESNFRPYMELLPTHFDTLMYWSDTELEELQASPIREKIGKKEAEEKFMTSVIPTVNRYADVFYPSGSRQLKHDELTALAHRAGSIIMAYAFDLLQEDDSEKVDEDGYIVDNDEVGLEKGLVPMADMLNGGADPNVCKSSGSSMTPAG